MNGRTCQLCGKPLSRFSVGTGGDFCSREHRNQFRLRLGMDRLQEANKVASLMRRRESAKPIPAGQLARDWKPSPRAASPMRMTVRPPAMHVMLPQAAALETPRIAAISRNPIAPSPAAKPVRSEVRPLEFSGSLVGHRKQTLLPPRAADAPVQLQAAGAVVLHTDEAPANGRRREGAIMGWRQARRHIGGNGIQVRPAAKTIRNCQEPHPALGLINSADRGQDLRVSGGMGFRVPKARVKRASLRGPEAAPLLKAAKPRGATAASQPKRVEARPAAIQLVVRSYTGPTPPSKLGVLEFRWPSVILPGMSRPRRTADSVDSARSCGVTWKGSAPLAPRVRLENKGVIPFRPQSAPAPLAETPEPREIHSDRRLTLMNFDPPETLFEWTPTALHGTLLSGMQFGSAPVRKPEPPPATTLEEHFDAGMQNWVGGIEDWKVDVAGVRAGSLAVYSPSLEMSNYLLEFLARIENRSVTWVFRATNFSDYYEMTLAVAQAGGYEFRRRAVIHETGEAIVVKPVPTNPASTKTAVTLRTRVVGNEFTVSLDGQVVDTWTDSRLASGGIGFVGAPDDRARLYWVKLTPVGHIIKEYSKQ